jgi:glycosyltransferase involved in cell wall biosynthesis
VLLVGDLYYVHVRRWAVGLAGRGIDVSVLSRTTVELPGVSVVPATVPPWRPWAPGRWVTRWRSLFRRAMATQDFDLVHLHYPQPYSLFVEELQGTPLIVSTWGSEILPMDAEPAHRKTLKVQYLRHARRVVALSNFLADATAEYGGLDRRDIAMQYWGVDLGQFTADADPCDEPVIGFAKALSKQYGAEYVIDALPRILDAVPQARVLMLGTGDLEGALRAQAQRLHVDHAIEWMGRVDYAEMPRAYARMTLSVMPSVYPSETLGVSALESQAMNVPVVASRIGGIPESVIDGETGILVPPRDARSLADAVVALLRDPGTRRRLGRQGRAHVARHFDWQRSLDNMTALYQTVIGTANGGAVPAGDVRRAEARRENVECAGSQQ